MTFLVRIDEGGLIPRGYGMAWRDWNTATGVCAPIPFNQILHQLRRLWHWFMLMHGGDAVERLVLDADRRGWERGAQGREDAVESARRQAYQDGYSAGRAAVLSEFEAHLMAPILARVAQPE